MGGRGAKMSRNTNPYSKRPLTKGAGGGTVAAGGGGNAALSEAVGTASFPQIKKFDAEKHIVSFNYKLNSTGRITIKDDTGRIFKGVYEGHGASRDTFGFKEGFVIKFDGLKSGGFRPGQQTKEEVKVYKNINKALVRPAGKSSTGVSFKQKSRVPDLVAAHFNKTIKLPSGEVRTGVAVSIMSKAKGGHDTGILASSKKGKQLIKRVRQYLSGLSKRGVNTNDIRVIPNGYKTKNIYLHNMYRDRKTGKIKIVDLGY